MPSQLKICFLIDTGIIGGPGKGLFQLLEYLNGEVDYTLCNFDYGAGASQQFNDYARAAGYPLQLLPHARGLGRIPVGELERVLKHCQIDALQTHGFKPNLLGYLVRRRLGIPWISVAHGWTKENNRVHLYNWLDLQLHRRSNCAIAVSPVLFDTLSQARGKHKPTYLISNAVELPPLSELAQRRQRTSQTEVLTIGVFGRLSHEKGHQVLIRAVERIVRDGSPLQVLIVGDGPERGTLESLVQQLNIQEYFRFVGYQANMAEWYNKIQLLVIPSLTEGLPNVLLEAMAAEIPAVATSVGAVPQVITHDENGWLIPAGDPDALAATLMRILQAPELIRKAGENARASLHPRFSPAARAQSFVDIYRSMLRPVQSTRPIPDRA